MAARELPNDPPIGPRDRIGPPRLRDASGRVVRETAGPPAAPSRGRIVARIAGRADMDAGVLEMDVAIAYPGGRDVGVFPLSMSLRGNRIHFLRRVAQFARELAAVRSDFPVRLICDVDD